MQNTGRDKNREEEDRKKDINGLISDQTFY